jgi:HTH-type transcriptional regulator/antitoxin HipB
MRVRTTRELGALVRDARTQRGLTQAALADQADVSRRWLAALETGKPGAELALVLRVLAALDLELSIAERTEASGVDLDDLLSRYDEDRPG